MTNINIKKISLEQFCFHNKVGGKYHVTEAQLKKYKQHIKQDVLREIAIEVSVNGVSQLYKAN